MDLAVQEKIFFWNVHKPVDSAKSPEYFLEVTNMNVKNEAFIVFKNLIENQLNIEDEICLEDILVPNWCRIHNEAHFKFTCSLCMDAINQVADPMEPPEQHEESIQQEVIGEKGLVLEELEIFLDVGENGSERQEDILVNNNDTCLDKSCVGDSAEVH